MEKKLKQMKKKQKQSQEPHDNQPAAVSKPAPRAAHTTGSTAAGRAVPLTAISLSAMLRLCFPAECSAE